MRYTWVIVLNQCAGPSRVAAAGVGAFPASYPNAAAGVGGHASHPYALAASTTSTTVVAIGGLAVINQAGVHPPVEQCQGRLLSVNISSTDGKMIYDSRFTSIEQDTNIECYGVTPSTNGDGGWVLTCGTGVEPELHPKDSKVSKTWRVLLHRTDVDGRQMWQTNYSDNCQLHDDAGEFIFGDRDGTCCTPRMSFCAHPSTVCVHAGGYVVLVDAQSWGPEDTGGNFAIMKLK